MEALLIKIYKFNFIGCQNSIYAIQHNILIYFSFVYFCQFVVIIKQKKVLLMNFSLLYSKFWALSYTKKSVSGRKNAYHLILFSKILSIFFQKLTFDSIIYTYSFYYSLIFSILSEDALDFDGYKFIFTGFNNLASLILPYM